MEDRANMGKQINFYMDYETEQRFVEFVLTDGGKILFRKPHSTIEHIEILPKPFSVDGWTQVFLYKEDFGDVILRQLKDMSERVDSICSPVIEFSRTVINEEEKTIYGGRLWMETKYWQNEDLLEKPKELDKWYSMLNKWLKKQIYKAEVLKNGRLIEEYITPKIKELLDNGYEIK